MDLFSISSGLLRTLLSGGGQSAGSEYCLGKNVTYEHRVDNPDGWNWCLVPNGGYDAVLFAAVAIAVMCLASPRWDALIVLFFGGIYFTFSYYYNLEHVSNAVMLWLGMRPADIFVFVFLPPFLLDLSVRIDFFMLKKVAFNIGFMAFVMVAASALILIPYMLYALDLKASGWTAGHVALFGSMIASTDAASVSAVLRSGGGPEILSVLLEGESLFNDASSLTLFEIFLEIVSEEEKTTLAHDLQKIVVKTIWSAFTGICIGLAMGIFTRWTYAWLQYRNMEAMAEVSWSVAGAYLSFYITQVWCKGSGCIGSVAFGLYGSATLLWGMSTKARLAGIFSQFWSVMTFIINGLIFFYVGASAVNFTIRSAETIFRDAGGNIELVKILLYKLPLIFLASFALRFILIYSSFKLFQLVRLSEGLSIQEVVFVTVGGLRGSLSLVLAQSAATMASDHQKPDDQRVKAEIAIYTAGYVIMTLLVNAPLCGPLLTLLGLDKIRQEQLAMRGEVKNLFRKFTLTAIEDLSAGQDEDELLQGLDWAMLRENTNFDKQLDKELPEVQPRVRWFDGFCTSYWHLLTLPVRLWRRFCGPLSSSSSSLGIDGLDADAKAEAEVTRQKQEADLKRATNFNLRGLQRAESRAPGLARGPTALIIRDQPAASLPSAGTSAGRSLPSSTSAGAGSSVGRRPPVAPSAVRRTNSRRLSSMVVSGASTAGVQPGSGVGVDRDRSYRRGAEGAERSFRRGNSRFLEGAVAGPSARSPLVSPGALGRGADGANGVDGGGADGGAELSIQLTPPPTLVLPPPHQRRASAPGCSGRENGGGGGSGSSDDSGAGGDEGGLVDPQMLALTEADGKAASPKAGPSALASQAANGTAPGSPGRSAPLLPPPPLAKLAQARASFGGDTMIEAALAAEAAETAAASATAAAAETAEEEAGPFAAAAAAAAAATAPPGALSPLSRVTGPGSPVTRAGPAGSGVFRPSPLSRGATGSSTANFNALTSTATAGPSSTKLSRLGASSSMTKIADPDPSEPSSEAAAITGGEAARGSVSEPEAAAASPAPAGGSTDRGLIQGLLVIKPGGGRASGAHAMPAALAPSASVRLVQRLGDEGGRGSGLEALRTETLAAASRPLGRSSVRAAGVSMPPLESIPSVPPVLEQEGVSMTSFSPGGFGERPLGRSSVSAPNAARPLGRASDVLSDLDAARSAGSGPPCLSPFEFALPEDMAAGTSFVSPFSTAQRDEPPTTVLNPPAIRKGEAGGLTRGSVRNSMAGDAGAGGLARGSVRQEGGLARTSIRGPAPDGGAGGGLARGSVRQGAAAAGGGALGRQSIRLGRQAGLAAASAQLARIYDSDVAAASASSGEGAAFRQSLAGADLLQPRASNQTPPPSSPARLPQSVSTHITSQVAAIQSREVTEGQQQQPPGQHQQYHLGSNSKGMLMSLIRRSVSHHAAHGPSVGTGGGPGLGREGSGRGSEGLARRTRFADVNTTAALAKASVSGALRQSSSYDVEGNSIGVCAPLLVEYRLRLLAGLKQYYRQKHAAGSLSPSSYKVLSYVADQSAHHPENPLSLWTMAKKEVSSGPLLEAEVSVYYRLKHWTAAAKASHNRLVRAVVPRMLGPFVWMLSLHISATTLSGLETAVELWASLTQSLQTEWLQYSGLYGELLLEEVQHEADGAWAYIIERRIEAPNKFGAVQTHRAVIDVLTQQQAFVREMNEGGMIDESECRKIVEVVEKRLQLLARRGPRWRQPTVMEILSGTAVLRGIPPRVVEWIRKNSTMRVYQQGAAIWDMGRKKAGAEPDGLIIVIRGVVRMMLEQDGALIPYYLGAGGVGGLVSCVLESHVPGMSSAAAYAEGNAMGKGPLVMHVPWSVLQVLRRFSREERLAPYQALDLQLYRTAAVYVLDLLRHQVTQQFSAFIRTSLLTILHSARLDGPTVRRQRIRLLLQPAAADHHVDGGIDWIGELMAQDTDTARGLLDPSWIGTGPPTATGPSPWGSAAALPSSPSDAAAAGAPQLQLHAQRGGAAVQPWVEAMYKAIAAATSAVLDVIRTSLKDSILVVLGPNQGIIQRTTMVLIQGSLEPMPIADADGTGGASNTGGPFVATSNEGHLAPSVMVWVSDYFEGELVAQRELEVVAGPRGATLLLWGVKPEDLLVHSLHAGPAASAGAAGPSGTGGAAAAGGAAGASPSLSPAVTMVPDVTTATSLPLQPAPPPALQTTVSSVKSSGAVGALELRPVPEGKGEVESPTDAGVEARVNGNGLAERKA